MAQVRTKKLAADDPRHGTTNGYGNFGCRCELCREAKSAQARELKASREASVTHEVEAIMAGEVSLLNGWTPGRPSVTGDYLACNSDGEVSIDTWLQRTFEWVSDDTITYWMPLPKAPT